MKIHLAWGRKWAIQTQCLPLLGRRGFRFFLSSGDDRGRLILLEAGKTKKRTGLKVLMGVVLALVIGYNIVFSAPVFEGIVKGGLARVMGGEINLKVEKSSLFRGFEFRDISFKTSDSTFFRADHFTISYFLPSMLIGHIGLRDLSLVRPEIHLKKRNGKWNF
ncbi:MAG: hypothetical protein JNM27_07665, partial [Leptospirales bacterium]|nr:hypothetical protein [Leptospirales bacterium]